MRNDAFDYSYYYKIWHSDTPESLQNDIRCVTEFIDAHHICPSDFESKILEVGCGWGRLMLMLQDLGYKNITGIDIDPSQLKMAEREKLNVFLADAHEFLEKNNETYDVIYALDILEHIAKNEQLPLLKLMNEHLSEDGFIVIRVPNGLAPLLGYFRYSDFTHTVSYTDISLRFLFHNSGFHFSAVRPSHHESEVVQKLKLPWARLYRTEFGLTDFLLTPNIVGIAFKNEKAFNRWMATAPEIKNEYLDLTPPHKKKYFGNLIYKIKGDDSNVLHIGPFKFVRRKKQKTT